MLYFIKAVGLQDRFLKVWKVDSRGEEFKAAELQGTPGGIGESNWKKQEEWDGEWSRNQWNDKSDKEVKVR